MPDPYIFWPFVVSLSVCAFMIGKTYSQNKREEIIETTIQSLMDLNLIRWKKDKNGEIELLEIDEK